MPLKLFQVARMKEEGLFHIFSFLCYGEKKTLDTTLVLQIEYYALRAERDRMMRGQLRIEQSSSLHL